MRIFKPAKYIPKAQHEEGVIKTRSLFETVVLNDMYREGMNYQYEPMSIDYQLNRTYTPDIVLPNGIILELKGLLTIDDRVKMAAIKYQHPELDIRFVFQNPNAPYEGARKRKKDGRKPTCAEWAEKNGFPYANRYVPKEWYNESPKTFTFENL